MKKLLISALFLSPMLAHAGVTSDYLGKLLLGHNHKKITQEYNVYNANGQTGPNSYGGYHPGVDYRARSPLQIHSPVSGTVSSIDSYSLGRISIKIDDSDDYLILLHMSEFFVKKGDRVQTGCLLGKTGSAGTSAPHLHVEVRKGKAKAAYYFKTSTNTGSNKFPGYPIPYGDIPNQSKECIN